MVEEILAKRALTKSNIPLTDFTINPYVGCSIGCKYCFARFIGSFKNYGGVWGRDVRVRKNLASLLKREIIRHPKWPVFLRTTCDPYQQLEKRYEITRAILRILVSHRIPVYLMTKSSLVRRDLDLLQAAEGEAKVLVTITTDREDVRKVLESGSSSFEERLETIDFLRDNGIQTGAFVGPVLPMDATRVALELSKRVEEVHLDPLNYSFQVKNIFLKFGWQSWLEKYTFQEVEEEFSKHLRLI
ncbi:MULTISPECIES: SPL family radical SAM protein [Mesotoga]|jgi:DNA repair photolyase|uniref:SPL family radical SAM protein n=2 Tax=Kosmotogaceae TaxID=1643948 RepID=UPI0002C907BB|nr:MULTISPECIES: radical SAM protein [Mesotoga]MCP5456988.1 radical SAM protein [Thermotogota bacterium]CCU84015.1 Radical SAM domain protein [Mesotoga infera]MCB1222785.1 radical SAM protein [Mesotoga sp.]MCP5460205.1 radical SAM protein [Thermotogota bacterium]MDD3461943.1 radical SAM protein [Mesotoga sp.]